MTTGRYSLLIYHSWKRQPWCASKLASELVIQVICPRCACHNQACPVTSRHDYVIPITYLYTSYGVGVIAIDEGLIRSRGVVRLVTLPQSSRLVIDHFVVVHMSPVNQTNCTRDDCLNIAVRLKYNHYNFDSSSTDTIHSHTL